MAARACVLDGVRWRSQRSMSPARQRLVWPPTEKDAGGHVTRGSERSVSHRVVERGSLPSSPCKQLDAAEAHSVARETACYYSLPAETV